LQEDSRRNRALFFASEHTISDVGAFLILRHAVALASIGWYLMIPPVGKDFNDFKRRVNGPLSTWIQDSAYDSAKECESAKNSLLTDRIIKSKRSSEPDTAARFAVATAAGKCVASDDPRLTGN
jgi:hypothetical protein